MKQSTIINNKTIKIIIILGPNASGKSEFAVQIAKKFNGEIISADSRQVYKWLDIGSGKVEGRWKKYFVYKNIIHHCVDFVSLKRVFSAGDFKNCAEKAILKITSHGKIPIICGGTGFYIDALLGNIKLSEGEPNWELRRELEKKPREELFAELQKLNPERAEKIDKNNKRRLIRAIEIFLSLRETEIKMVDEYTGERKILYIGISHSPEILRQRIEKRLKERIETGMIDEVCNLHFKHKVSWKRLNDLGLEYRYISYYLRGIINPVRNSKKNFIKHSNFVLKQRDISNGIKTKEDLVEILNNKIWQYAKRQLTWFKRNNKINWIGLSKKDFKKSEKLIKDFLKN